MKKILSQVLTLAFLLVGTVSTFAGDGKSQAKAVSSPENGGFVLASKSATSAVPNSSTSDSESQTGEKTYYLYYSVADTYSFKGWSKTVTDNSSTLTDNGQTVSVKAGAWKLIGTNTNVDTYYAIFARMILVDGEETSRSIRCKVNQTMTNEVKLTHVHAGTVSAAFDDASAALGYSVALKAGMATSSTNEDVATTFVVSYSPTVMTEGEERHVGTLTIASNNGLDTIVVTFSGEALDKQVPVFTWNPTEALFYCNTTIESIFSSNNTETTPVFTSSDPYIAEVIDGNLHVYNELGTTTITVSQPGNEDWVAREEQYLVASVCQTPQTLMALDGSNYSTFKVNENNASWKNSRVECGDATWGGFNYDDKYADFHFDGVPGLVTFNYACTSGAATDVVWYVSASVDNVNWSKLATWNNNNGSKSLVITDRGVRYLRFCYSGNFAGTFSNVVVTGHKEKFVIKESSLDFGNVLLDAENPVLTFTLDHANAGRVTLASSSDEHFVLLSDTVHGTGHEKEGEIAVSVKYLQGMEIGEHSATITLTDNFGNTASIPVHGTAINYTYGAYSASVCEGDSIEFEGVFYKQATVVNDIVLAEKNHLGGDSIVTLIVTVNPTYSFQDEAIQMYVGAEGTWRERDLSTYAVGVYTLYDSLQTEAGCDSIYSVVLTVEAIPATYGEYNAAFCAGDSIEYNGVWYKETFSGDVTLAEKNHLGGDSIVTLTVTVNPTFFFEDDLITIEEGTDSLWHEIQLSELEVGEHVLYDSLTVAETGCDSVWSVTVVVSAKQIIPTAIDETMVAPAATKFFRQGRIYIRRGEALYDMSGRKVE